MKKSNEKKIFSFLKKLQNMDFFSIKQNTFNNRKWRTLQRTDKILLTKFDSRNYLAKNAYTIGQFTDKK